VLRAMNENVTWLRTSRRVSHTEILFAGVRWQFHFTRGHRPGSAGDATTQKKPISWSTLLV